MTPTLDTFMGFYDATCNAAYRLALCITGDATTAEDAVTRAYVRAYRSGLDPRRHGHSLILGLVRDELTQALSELRRARLPQREAS